METFGGRIRARRIELGLTQRELAKLVEIDFTYLSKIENATLDDKDRPYIPSQEKIRALAKHLKLDVNELLMLAGTVPDQLQRSLQKMAEKKEFQEFYQSAKDLTPAEWKQLLEEYKARKGKA